MGRDKHERPVYYIDFKKLCEEKLSTEELVGLGAFFNSYTIANAMA